MKDQADSLRKRLQLQQSNKISKTIAVISGKGGVGKSNFSLNFSISLSKKGHSVLLFDMDIGMGNIDILMGTSSKKTIVDFFNKGTPLEDIISRGSDNISFIAGGSGLSSLFELEDEMFDRFMQELEDVMRRYDYIIFDMGAGITNESSKFILSADELVVITTPEPTSVMDAYSIMKYLVSVNPEIELFLVCNRVQDEKEGKETMKRLQDVLFKFLKKQAKPLGYLPDDRTVMKAVSRQVPFSLFNPNCDAAISLEQLTHRYQESSFKEDISLRKSNFLGKLKNYFLGR
ncbi:cobyrinic acid a,c-diamide synthase [Bacillus sp. M6-12]|uniref:MinD/ParA family protein n=1 Tax=Bacillus sp. M6-12 TaxID=2054166 RepID=UPI000C770004|nr:MinD/ParA family protein [Bacillus sp. M6-12]PLS16694.1 cobyrinic acid a,c-diamide synthase [Bacillus sp. M6-12]